MTAIPQESIELDVINADLIGNRIEELEKNYVESVFQSYYMPLTIEALDNEIGLAEELGIDAEGIKQRQSLKKSNELQVVTIRNMMPNVAKAIRHLRKVAAEAENNEAKAK